MYQNAVYICITWYSKICWFPVKNADVSRTHGMCHVIHLFFLIFFGWDIIVPSFIIVGHVWQILWKGSLFAPVPRQSLSSPKKAHPK